MCHRPRDLKKQTRGVRTWIHMRQGGKGNGREGNLRLPSALDGSGGGEKKKRVVCSWRSFHPEGRVEPIFAHITFHSQIAPTRRNQVVKKPKWRNKPPIHNRSVLG